ncbi:MAG: hypothetical protein H6Q92_353 [Nitrospirae bacterium]|jgi:phage terminase large subunit-like protein|nr:hypothetical protein [Nitrospirota bacterium]
MLVLRCTACRKKLWRYEKIGKGEVLRCHKTRIVRDYGNCLTDGQRIYCSCGKSIGIDKGNYYKMIGCAFTYAGTKRNV